MMLAGFDYKFNKTFLHLEIGVKKLKIKITAHGTLIFQNNADNVVSGLVHLSCKEQRDALPSDRWRDIRLIDTTKRDGMHLLSERKKKF